jgi:hypothetical protein
MQRWTTVIGTPPDVPATPVPEMPKAGRCHGARAGWTDFLRTSC